MIQFHLPAKLKVNATWRSLGFASAIKNYVFIKGSGELAGGREQPSTKGKVCDQHWGLVQFPVKNQTTA